MAPLLKRSAPNASPQASRRSFCRFFLDMRITCIYVFYMPKMIQLRKVPDSLHRKLKARAALEGLSLSDYLIEELRRFGEKPTFREMRERLSHRKTVRTTVPPSDAVREERERL
jgi:plasmid stability protein